MQTNRKADKIAQPSNPIFVLCAVGMSENYLHSQSASSYDSISPKLEGNIPVGLAIVFCSCILL
jgi:hypothetical protein